MTAHCAQSGQSPTLSHNRDLQIQGPALQHLAAFAVNTDGTYALLAGTPSQVGIASLHAYFYAEIVLTKLATQDQEQAAILLVNLAQSRPSRSGSNRHSTATVASKAITVQPDLYQNRPGLAILQITWHPGQRYPL